MTNYYDDLVDSLSTSLSNLWWQSLKYYGVRLVPEKHTYYFTQPATIYTYNLMGNDMLYVPLSPIHSLFFEGVVILLLLYALFVRRIDLVPSRVFYLVRALVRVFAMFFLYMFCANSCTAGPARQVHWAVSTPKYLLRIWSDHSARVWCVAQWPRDDSKVAMTSSDHIKKSVLLLVLMSTVTLTKITIPITLSLSVLRFVYLFPAQFILFSCPLS